MGLGKYAAPQRRYILNKVPVVQLFQLPPVWHPRPSGISAYAVTDGRSGLGSGRYGLVCPDVPDLRVGWRSFR